MPAALNSSNFPFVLKDVCGQIDRFLDPAITQLAGVPSADKIQLQDFPDGEIEPGSAAFNALAPKARMEFLNLCTERERLRFELEDERREADHFRAKTERQMTQDAVAKVRIDRELQRLETEHEAKRRRLDDAEAAISKLKSERDIFAADLKETSQSAQRDLQSSERQRESEKRLAQSERKRLNAKLDEALGEQRRCPQSYQMETALQARVVELEAEVSGLQLALSQGDADRALAAQLRKRHVSFEEELKDLRRVHEDLTALRDKHLVLDQEASSLRAQVTATDARLQDADTRLREGASAKKDLEAFMHMVAPIIQEARRLCWTEGSDASDMQDLDATNTALTPMELSLAWARCQAVMAKLQRRCEEQCRELENVAQRESEIRDEAVRVKEDLVAGTRREELQEAELRRGKDEVLSLSARLDVLRDLLGRTVEKKGLTAAKEQAEEVVKAELSVLQLQLDSAKSRAYDLKSRLALRESELKNRSDEAARLRSDLDKVKSLQVRVRQLERVNNELFSANESLERHKELLLLQVDDAAKRQALPSAAISGLSTASRDQFSAFDDEKLSDGDSVAQQYERFRQFTRQHVLNFREGVFRLLGWNVRLVCENGEQRWLLTSTYCSGKNDSLVFRLQPAALGQDATFELLSTPWAEELLKDRQALSYLEIQNSVPGFLAHTVNQLLLAAAVAAGAGPPQAPAPEPAPDLEDTVQSDSVADELGQAVPETIAQDPVVPEMSPLSTGVLASKPR